MFRNSLTVPALLLVFFPMTLLFAGCQADEPPPAEGGDDLGSGGQGVDPPGDNDPGDDSDDDTDDDEDQGDGNEGDGEEKLDARCGVGEEFLPLARGIEELDDFDLDVDADRDDGCKDCEVRDEKAVISRNPSQSARIYIPAGVLDGAEITVELNDPLRGVESAGFLVSGTGRYLSGRELQHVSIRLLRDDTTVVIVSGNSDDMEVHDTGDNFRQLLVVDVTEPFDALRIRMEGDEEEFLLMEVYAACVNSYGRKED